MFPDGCVGIKTTETIKYEQLTLFTNSKHNIHQKTSGYKTSTLVKVKRNLVICFYIVC